MTTKTETYEEPTGERRETEDVVEGSEEYSAPPTRASWGAIFAGTIVALAVSFVLALLGAAIGLGNVDPAQQGDPMAAFGTGAGIWLAIQFIIALFVGGWVAGRLAGKPRPLDGILNGGVVWALTIMLALFGASTFAVNAIGAMTAAAQEGAMTTAQTVAPALWWGLLAIVLGAAAACVGGLIGSPKMETWHEERRTGRRTGLGQRRREPTPAE